MVGAVESRERLSSPASFQPFSGLIAAQEATHRVASGETLSVIAARYGTDVQTLATINGIRNPDRIFAGDVLSLPAETRSEGSGGSPVGAVAPVGGLARLDNGTLSLTDADVLNLKKTLQTEWVQSAGDEQAHGIIDTILNRTASGHWGDSVAEVVNAYNQFSDINGPVSRRDGRNSVDDIPASQISARVDQMVDTYLAERAAGRESSIGSHLNYANPNYSSAHNLGWIMALDGPVLGRGDAIHRHGTVPELQRHRPDAFAVVLPADAAAPSSIQPPGALDGRQLAAQAGVDVKGPGVHIGRLAPEMAPVIRAVAEAAERLGLPTPVITSGNDSRHSDGSLHYSDQALDFRGNNISVAQGNALRDEVQRILGDRFDVLFETFANSSNNHLHVEFDPN